jgi:TDG/mug DNA glycosylase family protein
MDKLPDVLAPGLKIVFCGTAAGERSAQRGCYYAGPGNRFWLTLAEIGLTPGRLRPEEFRELPSYGLGLTDLAKKVSGADSTLRSSDFDVEAFRSRLIEAAPRFIAFNGKRAAAAFLGRRTRDVPVGPLPLRIGTAEVFMLPSTSGAARQHWSIEPWFALARLAGSAPASAR